VSLQLIVAAFPLHCRIASGFRVVQDHWLVEDVEAVDFLDSASRGFNVVEDDEGLALGLEVRLCDNLYDGAIFRENLLQSLFQLVDFDSLI
jgi:hypothetical protein